ncbi:MAG: CotH kinase family protein [Faecalibacterium sp.]
MKHQTKCKIAALLMAVVMASAVYLLVPDVLQYDLAYKNESNFGALSAEDIDESVLEFSSTLPIVYIYSYEMDKLLPDWTWTADGPVMPLQEESFVDLYVFSGNEENTLLDEVSELYQNAAMKLRGRTSSYMQVKKPLSLELRESDNESMDWPFLGFSAESDFVFHAPEIDRSLVRNYIAYQWQAAALEYAPATQFVEVFIDEADSGISMDDYAGVYLVVEKLKQGENRIDTQGFIIAEDPELQFEEGGGFIFKLDSYEEGYDNDLRLPTNDFGNTYTLVSPSDLTVDSEEVSVIMQEINTYEAALYGDDDELFAQYYDLEQFARCLLIAELMKNYEGFTSSFYMYRDVGGKIMPIQWDFDIGTGNIHYKSDFSYAEDFYVFESALAQALLQHDNFVEVLQAEWEAMRAAGGILSEEAIIADFAEVEALLDGAWQRNDAAYPDAFTSEQYANGSNQSETSQEDREYIEEFLLIRGRWLDENISTLG